MKKLRILKLGTTQTEQTAVPTRATLPAPPPSVEGVIKTLRTRLGVSPRHVRLIHANPQVLTSTVTGAEVSYDKLRREVVMAALSDLQVLHPIERTGMSWGAIRTGTWQHIGPDFRVRIRLAQYEDRLRFEITTAFRTPEEQAEADEAERKREEEQAAKDAERKAAQAARLAAKTKAAKPSGMKIMKLKRP